ncbi:carbamoyltransferase N-terminal domain-containing protein [Ekhidna sp.]|uniref:carbamoyltransferase N-terminal domain-containing protein n=1 Tax=Ekhidna sp. TaxID=2608089 RepID=UPI003299EDB4
MIIGVNLNHDYAYSIISDNNVYLREMERYSRVRHHWNRDSYTLMILDELSINELKNVHAIYLNSPNMNQIEEKGGILSSHSRDYIYSGEYLTANHPNGIAYGKLEVEGIEIPCAWVSHYHAHAASTFYSSGYSDTDVFCLDGGGDWGFGGWFYGQNRKLNLSQQFMSCELGLSYHSFSKKIFNATKGFYESKAMALAGFGKKKNSTHRFLNKDTTWQTELDTVISVHDIAQFQFDFEQGILDLINKHKKHEYLCCAGGCFLNVSLNKQLADSKIYKGIHIPPYAPDMGTAIGCAIYGCLDNKIDIPVESLQNPYLGDYIHVSVTEIKRIIEQNGDSIYS